MFSKTTGLILIILGILLMVYTGFNYVTTKKVVDLGPIQITEKKNQPIQWSPVPGAVLLAGGIIVFMVSKKTRP